MAARRRTKKQQSRKRARAAADEEDYVEGKAKVRHKAEVRPAQVRHAGVLPWVGGVATLQHVDHNVVRFILGLLSNDDLFSCVATCRFLYSDARHVLCARAEAAFGVPDPMALMALDWFKDASYMGEKGLAVFVSP